MSLRIEKINELIRQKLGQIIAEEIELPPSSFVTITKVETSPDIKLSKIFITVYPEKFRGTILEILKKKNYFLANSLKKHLTTKFVPNLNFVIDEQQIFASEVDKILDELSRK